VVRFQIEPPPNSVFGSGGGFSRADGGAGVVLSPDGQQLAFVAQTGNRIQLWIRRLDGFAARPLDGTDDAMLPFWAPDGRALAFFSGTKLMRVNLNDAAVQVVCETGGVARGGAWGSAGIIVFSSGTPPVMARVSAQGGQVTTLTQPGQGFSRFPVFLPDGRRFLYQGRASLEEPVSVMLASTEGAFSPRAIVATESNPVFAPPDVLLFVRNGALVQQRIDPERLEPVGEATAVVGQISMNVGLGRADFSASSTGVLAYRSVSGDTSQFTWFDRSGQALETVGAAGNYRTHDLSPDGTRLVYTDVNQGDLWILDLVRKASSRFTSERGVETAPAWFPDGSTIAYRRDGNGLFKKDVSGTGTEARILSEGINGPDQVSSDGRLIVFFKATPKTLQDVYIVPTSGDGPPKPLIESPFADVEPQLSPNMKWLAYASNETQRNEIYVQPFPPNGKRWRVSDSGGRQPLWRADGKELFFVADDRRFYSVDVMEKGDEFDWSTPRFLFEMRANVFNSRNSYTPSRDGKRFLINTLVGGDDAPISVVQNWPASVRE
jgi:Tol biopolymer transport system component